MKAKKAPEKIYLDPEIVASSEVTFIEAIVPEFRAEKNDIEYIRTDALIDKVCNWIEKNYKEYVITDIDDKYIGIDSLFIEDLKNAMEGE